MSDVVVSFNRALDSFDSSMRRLTPDAMGNATPCADWSVHDLVNHVVGECAWVPPLMQGRTIGDVGSALDGDLLGEDATAAWDGWSSKARSSFAADGAEERTVQLSFGPTPAAEYCRQLTLDALVHGWDLDRGLGGDGAMDEDLAAEIEAYLAPQVEVWRSAGAFADPVEVPAGSPASVRLLGMTGRRAT